MGIFIFCDDTGYSLESLDIQRIEKFLINCFGNQKKLENDEERIVQWKKLRPANDRTRHNVFKRWFHTDSGSHHSTSSEKNYELMRNFISTWVEKSCFESAWFLDVFSKMYAVMLFILEKGWSRLPEEIVPASPTHAREIICTHPKRMNSIVKCNAFKAQARLCESIERRRQG